MSLTRLDWTRLDSVGVYAPEYISDAQTNECYESNYPDFCIPGWLAVPIPDKWSSTVVFITRWFVVTVRYISIFKGIILYSEWIKI